MAHPDDPREVSPKQKRPMAAGPRFVPPQLATQRSEPPRGDSWLHEIKYDGYRIQVLIENGQVRLITRNGKDWTDRFRAIADELAALKVDSALIDGELVALDRKGRSRFDLLQAAGARRGVKLGYFAFDLLYINGLDLRSETLLERKRRLRALLVKEGRSVHYSDDIRGDGHQVFAKACQMKLEGIISKKANAPYRSGRGPSWVKSKCIGSEEFVIAGYRKSGRRGRPFASLLLGEYSGGRLIYRGRVGTGFDERTLDLLRAKMKPLERETCPFEALPRQARRDAVWLRPELVAQIRYSERTPDGLLRQPSFRGLREDKRADAVTWTPADGETTRVQGVRFTHPDRVVYPDQGATKRRIAQYYAAHAKRVLTYLSGRPVTLLRCPSGLGDDCFFQRHHNEAFPEWLKPEKAGREGNGLAPYLLIDSVRGLIAAVQVGALEFHIWGARADRIERPERLVFDLDPDESVEFKTVRSAAAELRDVLAAANLTSFALLTGGKGIHVIAPIERRRGWDDIAAFAGGLARRLAQAAPGRYVAEPSLTKRKDRIFIDWLRNRKGATAIAPYSLRARPGAPVATPVSWEELPGIESAAQFSLDTIDNRLSRLKADPWKGYTSIRQSITKGLLEQVG